MTVRCTYTHAILKTEAILSWLREVKTGDQGAYNGQKEPDDCGGCQGSDGQEGFCSRVISGSADLFHLTRP